jgi:hypothetical protein
MMREISDSMGGAIMPARVWILLFGLAGSVLSFAIAIAGIAGSITAVVVLAGAVFVLSLVESVVGYQYMKVSDRETAAMKTEIEAGRRRGKWLQSNRMPYSSGSPDDLNDSW